ncbi:hypothetical protein Tco_0778072 [Tanacetum coccineum]
MENYKNVSQDIRDQLNAEAEAFGKFTSRDGESLESYYLRFYKMMNELVRNQCHVTNHQVKCQFLTSSKPEWQSSNQQPVYHHQTEPNSKQPIFRHQIATFYQKQGKAIVTRKSSAPTYDPELLTKIYKPTTTSLELHQTPASKQDNSPRSNMKNVLQLQGIRACIKGMSKPKRVKDAAYHKEKMLLCKQEEAGVQLNAEQADWKDDTDDESEEQEIGSTLYVTWHNTRGYFQIQLTSGPIF